jgi:hypothetical protein
MTQGFSMYSRRSTNYRRSAKYRRSKERCKGYMNMNRKFLVAATVAVSCAQNSNLTHIHIPDHVQCPPKKKK